MREREKQDDDEFLVCLVSLVSAEDRAVRAGEAIKDMVAPTADHVQCAIKIGVSKPRIINHELDPDFITCRQ